MKQVSLLALFTILFAPAFCWGLTIKTSSIIEQPSVEVLGDYKGFWYVIGFEKPGNMNKPPEYKIMKYTPGFPSAKTSITYNSFGEKTVYLRAAFIGGKISLFYGKCEKRDDVKFMLDGREGRSPMSQIYRQDFDPVTLEGVGGPQLIYDELDEHFSASGMDIAYSQDRSKAAILIKCYYRQQFYKVLLFDDKAGQVYSKIFNFKETKEFLQFQGISVHNNGESVVVAKVRTDVVTLNSSSKDKKAAKFYVFGIDNAGNTPKIETIESPAGGHYLKDPTLATLATNETLVAFPYTDNEKSNAVSGILLRKFDGALSGGGSRDVCADPALLAQAADFGVGKKDKGFPYLAIQQVLALEGGGFMVLAEHQRDIKKDPKDSVATAERHYLIAYRFDGNMALKGSNFIAKKQVSPTVGYSFSARAFAVKSDVYLFYNDNWEADEEHGTNLMCTRLPADGGAASTQKVVHTSDDFFTSMEQVFPRADGKVMFTEEKLVDFEDVSRQVKLLEVSLK